MNQPVEIREKIKEVHIDTQKRIDVRLLASLIGNKCRNGINQVIERRKQMCLGRVRELMAQEQEVMRTSIVRSS